MSSGLSKKLSTLSYQNLYVSTLPGAKIKLKSRTFSLFSKYLKSSWGCREEPRSVYSSLALVILIRPALQSSSGASSSRHFQISHGVDRHPESQLGSSNMWRAWWPFWRLFLDCFLCAWYVSVNAAAHWATWLLFPSHYHGV